VKVVRVETDDGRVVCERCEVAGSFVTRGRGLLGRDHLAPGDGILLRPAGSVHTLFMRFPIDAVFCDKELRVVGVAADLRPWRFAGRLHARVTIELAAGEAAHRGVVAGTRLRLVEP
jgi:uncharacterized membrane protein (UPF0127 family)